MLLKHVNRWQAFAIHLGLSLTIFVILLLVIIYVWYPGLFIAFGGWQGIKLVAGVDLVLGPMLTLIIYNPLKEKLKWDLTIIGLIQISCLIAGVYQVHKQRPIAQVLSDDGIYIITLSDYKNATIPKDIQNIEGRYPKFVFLDLPNNPAEISTLKFTQELIEGASIETRADLYLASGAVPSKDLESRLEAFPFNQEENCRWIPVYASKTTGQACVSAEHGIIDLKKEA